ncbi:CfrBI family restriction endonuclease [Kingella negevensis]|uniref:CfrBI family restriction endonuclease n=1 Tax=Kingella negevensis TaxID=1522312 RepID=UPI00254CBA9F|nr:CfrBI family restriction endonuclease [Kingella negevensis]MDK4707684.1 CfrBI family restriction endonuclease [Kingella negevensis]MDK4709880.1 CfrBI family restriction endonuclease [Kingella negevensis]
MKITNQVTKNIIKRVIQSKDYRIKIVNLLNAEFLQFSIDFFKKVVAAKLNSQYITIDWYKTYFLADTLSKDEIIIHSGLNEKTIKNMYGTTAKSAVIDASSEHFETLYNSIQSLVENEQNEIDLTLTIKLKGVSVDLSISESLIVINTLAVKRSQIRGGLWSTAGKSVEKYLMLSLCQLYQVSEIHYGSSTFVKDKSKKVDREIDFYLIDDNKQKYLCEVKLMGAGNPESADAIIARNSHVFVADTLSQQNKNQCDELGVLWVALREPQGFFKFGTILQQLNIPYQPYQYENHEKLNRDLDRILDNLLD